MTPAQWLRSALTMLPPGSLVLVVCPPRDGGPLETHFHAAEDATLSQAMEQFAAAQVQLNRQTAVLMAAVAEASGVEEEQVLELYRHKVEERQALAEAMHEEAKTTVERTKAVAFCQCALPKPREAIVKGVAVKACAGCGLPIRGLPGELGLREVRKRREQ